MHSFLHYLGLDVIDHPQWLHLIAGSGALFACALLIYYIYEISIFGFHFGTIISYASPMCWGEIIRKSIEDKKFEYNACTTNNFEAFMILSFIGILIIAAYVGAGMMQGVTLEEAAVVEPQHTPLGIVTSFIPPIPYILSFAASFAFYEIMINNYKNQIEKIGMYYFSLGIISIATLSPIIVIGGLHVLRIAYIHLTKKKKEEEKLN